MMLLIKKPLLPTVVTKYKPTPEERMVIKHYKDLINPQFKWDLKPLRHLLKGIGIDCFIINGVLRGIIPINSLSERDRSLFNYAVSLLTNAINKSVVINDTYVYKGLSDSEWVDEYKTGDIYIDRGFGSFTPSKTVADKYANKNKKKVKVYIYLELKSGTNALYLDDGGEKEYILPPKTAYHIVKIDRKKQSNIYYVERA